MPKEINTRDLAQKFLDDHDTFLFDCDGVLWRGSELLPNTIEILRLLRQNKKQLVFVTNNGTKSRKQYISKFAKLGIEAQLEEVFGSAYSAAVYLQKIGNFDRSKQKVLVIGEKGLEEELNEAGFQTVGGSDPNLNKAFNTEDEANLVKRDASIGAVVCSLDTHINYLKIAMAQAQLRDPEVLFLATNIDSTYPSSGKVLPGAGTVIKAVSYCSDRDPDAILGKPSKEMMNCIEAQFQFDPKRTVMIGDRLNTDMMFGSNSGLDTLFVLTGIDSLEGIANSNVDPTFYAESLGKLYDLLE